MLGESEGLTQPALLSHFQAQPHIWASPAHVSSIPPWSDGILVMTYFQSLGVFWVSGRKDILCDSEITKIFIKKNHKEFSRLLTGLRRLSMVPHKKNNMIMISGIFFETE